MDISPKIITRGASKGELSYNHFCLALSVLVFRSRLNQQMINEKIRKEQSILGSDLLLCP